MTPPVLVLGLAAAIGGVLGLLGGGGAILTTPLLTYVAGLPTKQAIASSLVVVALTSAVAMLTHARAGRVQWRTGLLFGAGGMVGAHLGGRAAHPIPPQVLLLLFAAMMAVSAIAMLRGRRAVTAPTTGELRAVRFVAQGMAVGFMTGLVGAGGGFVIVPALVVLGRLPMRQAIGTSLLVIAMNSTAGLTGYLGHETIDWAPTLAIAGLAVLGSLVGARASGRVPQDTLRLGFGWLVMAIAAFILIKELA